MDAAANLTPADFLWARPRNPSGALAVETHGRFGQGDYAKFQACNSI